MNEFASRLIRKIYYSCFYGFEYFYYRIFYKKPNLKLNENHRNRRYLIANGENFEKVSSDYKKIYPQKSEFKIKEADLICGHIFDLLGSGPKKISREDKESRSIDWHSDFKSKYKWNPNKFYKNIRYGHIRGVDVKVPWELSRFQHLNILGQAYILTDDKKYADEFVKQITDWIERNPVAFGVNWSCAMEVAIRAANWLVAQEYFSGSDHITNNFWNEFYSSIYEHGIFLKKHLENEGEVNNNHYLSNLVGLFFISVYCPFFKESEEWRIFAAEELSKEIKKQVYPDGCSFEASTSYHRLVLELLYYTELLSGRAGIDFTSDYKDRVRKMFEFSLYCIKPNGKIPQIGDNDNGRFLILSKRPILEHRYLLSFAAVHYKDSEFKNPGWEYDEEAFWLFGERGKEIYDGIPEREEPLHLKEFPDAGWFIIRDEDDYCFVSAGPNGQRGTGGHAHNDKLSFELMIHGEDIIQDPGTYVYTPYPEERNKFRSTSYHNTLNLNGHEQNSLSKERLFNLSGNVQIDEAYMKKSNNHIFFEGKINYPGLSHKRIIFKDKNSGSWNITDRWDTSAQNKIRARFHLSPEVKLENMNIIDKAEQKKVVSIHFNPGDLIKEKYEFSPGYGKKLPADCLIVNIPSDKNEFMLSFSLGNRDETSIH